MNNNASQTSDTFALSVLLSLSGGFQDAYTYILRGKVFANAQTGNVVLMSQHFMEKEWKLGFHYLLPVLAFALGILITEQTEHKCKNSKRLHWRQLIVIAELIVLTAVAFIPTQFNTIANVLVSFSCAMQVQAFRTFNGYTYASTMCIGNLRSGTESLSVYLRDKKTDALSKAAHYFGIIFVFAVGAGLGGIISKEFGNMSILVSCILLLTAFTMMNRKKAK